jgi:transcription elongation factor Elf1
MQCFGQFNASENTGVRCEFPCPDCGQTVQAEFRFKGEHSDEVASCSCGKNFDIVITKDLGSGILTVTDFKTEQQNVVKAHGIKI